MSSNITICIKTAKEIIDYFGDVPELLSRDDLSTKYIVCPTRVGQTYLYPWSEEGSTPIVFREKGKCEHGKARNGYVCKECPGKGICEHNKARSRCKECDGGSICEHNKIRSQCKNCGGSQICEHSKQRHQCKECGGSGICEHNRIRSHCKECGGSQICEHNRVRSTCKECGGSQICGHNKIRSQCKNCGGSQICEHNRRRSFCKDCGGSQICVHKREKSYCKYCRGSAICEHNRVRSCCRDCGGGSICEHKRVRNCCKECGGSQICVHNRRKSHCKECGGSQICEHNRIRSHCKECGGGSICEHNRVRSECKNCGGSQICEHKRVRSHCKQCRFELPIDKALAKYKHACIVCAAPLRTLKRKLERLCGEHSQNYAKRPEHYWRDMIIQAIDFEPTTVDQTVYTSGGCKTGRYRPDMTYHTITKSSISDRIMESGRGLVIALEFDEHSHADYDTGCELTRLVNMKDAYPDDTLLVIRMNPDSCKSTPKEYKDLSAKTLYMTEVLRTYLDNQEYCNDLSEEVTNVIYIFYNDAGRKHIDASFLVPDKVSVIDTLYCSF